MAREPTTDLAMLDELVALDGKDVVDVGCGGGALVRALSARGARVSGVEISDAQLRPALARDPERVAHYLVGRAQQLPLHDASTDIVVYMRSLHHVPPEDLDLALREARRVLRPAGVVYVSEPLAVGDFYELTSLVEDELGVRAAAQAALARCAAAGLRRTRTVDYEVIVCVADLDALRARLVSVDPDREAIFAARRAELVEAFARLGDRGECDGERCFRVPMRADVLAAVG